jgi:hypothetical protein
MVITLACGGVTAMLVVLRFVVCRRNTIRIGGGPLVVSIDLERAACYLCTAFSPEELV